MKTILVVDDDPMIRELLVEVLEDEGYMVLAVEDGETALAQSQNIMPHLVLTDIMMPRMTGEELCRQLKSQPHYATTPVVLMSAYRRPSQSTCPYEAFVQKPFTIPTILTVLAMALSGGAP